MPIGQNSNQPYDDNFGAYNKDWDSPVNDPNITSFGSYDPVTGTYKYPSGGSGGGGTLPFGGNSGAQPALGMTGDPLTGGLGSTGTGALGGASGGIGSGAGVGAAGSAAAGQGGIWQNILTALGSSSAGGYAGALKTYGPYIMALISAVTGNKGKFEQNPEDPALTAARNKQIGFVDNSPTRDLYGGLLSSFMQGGGVSGWKSPAPLAGGQFYQSQGMGQGGNDALTAYIHQVMSGLAPQQPASSPGGFTPEKDKFQGAGLVP